MLWLTGLFLYIWRFIKIFLNPRLSLIVPLRLTYPWLSRLGLLPIRRTTVMSLIKGLWKTGEIKKSFKRQTLLRSWILSRKGRQRLFKLTTFWQIKVLHFWQWAQSCPENLDFDFHHDLQRKTGSTPKYRVWLDLRMDFYPKMVTSIMIPILTAEWPWTTKWRPLSWSPGKWSHHPLSLRNTLLDYLGPQNRALHHFPQGKLMAPPKFENLTSGWPLTIKWWTPSWSPG